MNNKINSNTDVLIVGAGPTGLMLACQLSRFGIPFIIIDKTVASAKESRAIAIQSKTMEVLQNLDLASDFLEKATVAKQGLFYFNNTLRVELDLETLDIEGTPFPHVFFLPQSETEHILENFLNQKAIFVQRNTTLTSFAETKNGIEAVVKNQSTQQTDKINCKYIVGCDGSKSVVRDFLNIPFEGGSYQQEFLLADATVTWKFPKNAFSLFVNSKGILVHVPLDKNYSRLIFSSMDSITSNTDQPTTGEIEAFAKTVMGIDLKLDHPLWTARFHLHHRAVKQYQKGASF